MSGVITFGFGDIENPGSIITYGFGSSGESLIRLSFLLDIQQSVGFLLER